MESRFKSNLLLILIILALGLGITTKGKVNANPLNVFTPSLKEIENSLPPGWVMRLPSVLIFPNTPEAQNGQLFVRVFSSKTPPNLTVGLSTCKVSPHPCLLASFAVDSKDSLNAQQELIKHKNNGKIVDLDHNIEAFIWEGSKENPSIPFSSIMWEQAGMIYTVTLVDRERQRLRDLAYSMANNRFPIFSSKSKPTQ